MDWTRFCLSREFGCQLGCQRAKKRTGDYRRSSRLSLSNAIFFGSPTRARTWNLLIISLWAWMKGLGFSRHHGIVSSAYGVYRPRLEFANHWQYFDNLLRSKVYDWELHVRSKG